MQRSRETRKISRGGYDRPARNLEIDKPVPNSFEIIRSKSECALAECRLHYLCTGKCTVRATFEMDMKRRKASSRQTDKERQCIKDRTKSRP